MAILQNGINANSTTPLSVPQGGSGVNAPLAHGVLVGEGTSPFASLAVGTTGQVLTGQSGSDPGFQNLGTNSGLTAHGILLGEGNSAIVATAALTNGQLLIGSTGADPVPASLTAGTGISITPGAGSITIAATGSSGVLPFTDITSATQTIAVNNGYTSNDGSSLVTFTLPSTAAYGTIFRVVGKATGLWQISQNAGQTIHYGNLNTTTGTGGSLASTNQYDCVEILCTIANTDFTVLSSQGNINVT